MQNKKILVCGIGSGMSNALKDIYNMGLDIIVINDIIDDYVINYSILAIQCYPRSIDDVMGIIDEYGISNFDGVISLGYENLPVIAEIVERFNLIGLSKIDAYNCTFKNYRIEIFSDNGIKTPKFVVAKGLQEAIIGVESIGFPCVIKPNDKTSSIGVIKLLNNINLKKNINEVLNHSASNTIIIEEFLSGTEHTFEGIVYNNDLIITGISDRNYIEKEKFYPYFFENGDTLPSFLNELIINEISEVIKKGARALNLNNTAFHCDIMLTNEGNIILLEMVGRISGARFGTELVKLATGINVLPNVVRLALGDDLNFEELKQKYNRAVVSRYLVGGYGRIKHIGSLDSIKKMKGVYDIMREQELKTGDYVQPYRNGKDVIASVIAYGDTLQEAEDNANDALKCIPIKFI